MRLVTTSSLKRFEVSGQNGFLPNESPLARLPDNYYTPWESIIHNLPVLLRDRNLRDRVQTLPLLETRKLRAVEEWQRAYVILSFITHAYIWQGPAPAELLPPQIAVPFLVVADYFDLPTTAAYAATTLWNFAPISSSGPLYDPENLRALHTFTGTKDEEWFYMISVAIEARGGSSIPLVVSILDAAATKDAKAVARGLSELSAMLEELGSLLDRMYEHCAPTVFYHQIRPMLAGTRNMAQAGLPNGVFYDEGCGRGLWRMYSGGSNAQSSLIQFFDVILGVQHGHGTMSEVDSTPESHGYLQEMRRYMPVSHAEFLSHLDSMTPLRNYVIAQPVFSPVAEAYNAAVTSLTAFRDRHIKIVTKYIILPSQASGEAPVKVNQLNLATVSMESSTKTNSELKDSLRGTGGTSLIPFLKQTRDETRDTHHNESFPMADQRSA